MLPLQILFSLQRKESWEREEPCLSLKMLLLMQRKENRVDNQHPHSEAPGFLSRATDAELNQQATFSERDWQSNPLGTHPEHSLPGAAPQWLLQGAERTLTGTSPSSRAPPAQPETWEGASCQQEGHVESGSSHTTSPPGKEVTVYVNLGKLLLTSHSHLCVFFPKKTNQHEQLAINSILIYPGKLGNTSTKSAKHPIWHTKNKIELKTPLSPLHNTLILSTEY